MAELLSFRLTVKFTMNIFNTLFYDGAGRHDRSYA
jgi:hypothetical protein